MLSDCTRSDMIRSGNDILTRTQWTLVLAGVSDFARPAEKLSFTQNFALTCTGLIWTRWCFIIRPKNMLYENFPRDMSLL